MGLNWNEIKSRALLFSKTWADACNENSLAKPFWIDFFEIFGITDKRVGTFELKVQQLGDKRGFMDLFCPGMLLVEHKSRGEDLDKASVSMLLQNITRARKRLNIVLINNEPLLIRCLGILS